jgi:hypothetical protein
MWSSIKLICYNGKNNVRLHVNKLKDDGLGSSAGPYLNCLLRVIQSIPKSFEDISMH